MRKQGGANPKAGGEEKKTSRFLNAFLFTENGKPKSSLMTYTFCLSFVFIAVYALCYAGAIEWLTAPLSTLPAYASNLLQSLLASGVGVGFALLLHHFLRDKRLVFGGHLWLALYAVAVLIAMLILMRGAEGVQAFLVFYAWFILAPVVVGLIVTGFAYRRSLINRPVETQEPEWKKYVNRR